MSDSSKQVPEGLGTLECEGEMSEDQVSKSDVDSNLPFPRKGTIDMAEPNNSAIGRLARILLDIARNPLAS